MFEDWNEYCDIYFNRLEAIKKYQIFQAFEEEIGMIECFKSNLDDADPVQDFILKPNIPTEIPGEPNKLYTERKGIRDIKAVGIWENYHDLIDEKYHNEMCPKPALDVWIRVKNYYPIGTKIEREFRKNGILFTAAVVDFNLETKLYTLQWEEENEDTEKENNYTGRKIGMYLHSDELEKFEIGECIRKKFDGLVYDGEIVSVNLETKLYHIKYSDGDEEDMTVSDIRKFWIAKEVNKKKRGSKKRRTAK